MKRFFTILLGILTAFMLTEVLLYVTLPITNIPWGPGVTPYQRTYMQTNSMGYRDREYEYKKPDGTTRIALIGDSFVFGTTKDPIAGLARQLEETLEQTTARDVEVMNFGKNGANTHDEIATLQTDVLPYEPDLIILVYLPNDADPLTRSDALLPPHTFNLLSEVKLLFQTANEARRMQDFSILRSFLQSRSFLFTLLDTQLGHLLVATGVRTSPLETTTARLYSGENLRRHREDLITFMHKTQQQNIPLLTVHFPFLFQLENYPETFLSVRDFVREATWQEDVPFLDLTPSLRKEETETLVVGWWDGHPNRRANRIAAAAIAESIQKNALLDPD